MWPKGVGKNQVFQLAVKEEVERMPGVEMMANQGQLQWEIIRKERKQTLSGGSWYILVQSRRGILLLGDSRTTLEAKAAIASNPWSPAQRLLLLLDCFVSSHLPMCILNITTSAWTNSRWSLCIRSTMFIEHLLHARHCFRHLGYSKEQTS